MAFTAPETDLVEEKGFVAPESDLAPRGFSAPESDVVKIDSSALKLQEEIDSSSKKYSEGDSAFTAELVNAARDNPKEFAKNVASGAAQAVMAPFSVVGQNVNAALQDAGATISGNPSQGGNLYALNAATSPEEAEELLPYQETLRDISGTNPKLATAEKIISGVVQASPMMAAGMPAGVVGRLISLGFSADMIHSGGEAATVLGEELGKPPEQRDMDRVTTAVSDLTQSAAFAPMAGNHALKEPVSKAATIVSLTKQLMAEPMVAPKTSTPIESRGTVLKQAAEVAKENNAPLTALALEAKADQPAVKESLTTEEKQIIQSLDEIQNNRPPESPSGEASREIKNVEEAQDSVREIGKTEEAKNLGEQEPESPAEVTDDSQRPDFPVLKNHVATYGGKDVVVDYVNRREGESKKQYEAREFRTAAQRVSDNLKTGEKGYVTTPKGERFEISTSSRRAKLVNEEAPKRETIEPAKDSSIGENSAGEKIYQRSDGSTYRMRTDRKDRPSGYPDFGGDLSPVKPPREIIGMGGAIPSEFKAGSGTPSSNKNAVVDAERAKRGLDPMMTPLRQTFGEAFDKAMAKIDQDPTFQDRLIAELKDSPRALEDWENAALLQRRVDLRNEYEKSARDAVQAFDDGRLDQMAEDNARTAMWSDKLSELELVTKSAGTESGRSLAARKMMMNEDFSLASLEMQKRAAKGGKPLTDAERAELKKIADDYKAANDALEKHLSEREAKVSELESQRAIDRIKLESVPNSYIISVAEKIVAGLDKRADAARARLRERMGRTSAGVDPTVLLDIAEIGASHIGHVGLDFAKWSAKMVDDIGDWVKPHLEEAWKTSQEIIDKQANTYGANKEKAKRQVKKQDAKEKTDKIGESIKKKVAYGKADSISIEAQKLARMFVELGVKDRDALIDAVHNELKNYLPEISRRETMDAISGYGKFSQLSKDQISVELRDLKGQMQQVGKLEDMQAGQAPAKTGVERRSPSDEERRLIKQVEEAKKKGGYKVTDPETQLRSALQSAKTRLENQIKDLEHEISTKEKIVRNKTTAQTSPEIEALKARRDSLKAERDEIFGDKLTTDEQRLKAWKTRVISRIAELESKMSVGDFKPKAKPEPPKFDSEGLKLKYELEQVKKRWNEMKLNDWLTNRSTGQKVLGTAAEIMNTSRAIQTSIDFSAVLRQGGFIVFGNPVRGAKSLVPMFRAFASERGQLRAMEEINSRPNAGLYRQAKLYIAEEGTSLHKMEEAYMSRWAKKIPGVAGSERAYTTFLNKLRADSFDAMAEGMGRNGAVTLEEAKVIANFINIATGRGDLGKFNQAAVGLNTVFFSPRYMASRFQILAGQPFYKGNSRTRAAIAKEYGKFLIGAGIVYALASAATDEKIESDPRSSDFGKIKFGNTRIDPLGGLLQDTVLVSKIASGKQKDSHGNLIPVRGDKVPFGKPDSFALMTRFMRSKLSPAVGFGVDVATGKDVVGNPVTVASSASKTLVPISVGDIYKTMIDQGATRGTALGILALFGLGVQTYDKKKKDKKAE